MLCSIYQWLISAALDGDKPLGRLTMRHVRRCPRCGQFWRASAALDHQLRVEATSAVPVSPGRRPVRSRPGIVLARGRFVRKALLTGGIALAAIILLAVALTVRERKKPAPINPVVPPPPGLSGEFALVPVQEVHDLAAASARAEMNYLAQDAQDAARMLLSYLPTNADQITGPRR